MKESIWYYSFVDEMELREMSFFFSFFPIWRILEHVNSNGNNPLIKKWFID